jgi:hypothetical protein
MGSQLPEVCCWMFCMWQCLPAAAAAVHSLLLLLYTPCCCCCCCTLIAAAAVHSLLLLLLYTHCCCCCCSLPLRRSGVAGMEDGTLPFTAIAAARHGFQQLQLLGGFPAISRHMTCLTWHTMTHLVQLRHGNGQQVAVLYCQPAVQQLLLTYGSGSSSSSSSSNISGSVSNSISTAGYCSSENRGASPAAAAPSEEGLARFSELHGPVVSFNLLRADGSWVGHKEVAKLAQIHNICVRTGEH